jgi:hypothetical protein
VWLKDDGKKPAIDSAFSSSHQSLKPPSTPISHPTYHRHPAGQNPSAVGIHKQMLKTLKIHRRKKKRTLWMDGGFGDMRYMMYACSWKEGTDWDGMEWSTIPFVSSCSRAQRIDGLGMGL